MQVQCGLGAVNGTALGSGRLLLLERAQHMPNEHIALQLNLQTQPTHHMQLHHPIATLHQLHGLDMCIASWTDDSQSLHLCDHGNLDYLDPRLVLQDHLHNSMSPAEKCLMSNSRPCLCVMRCTYVGKHLEVSQDIHIWTDTSKSKSKSLSCEIGASTSNRPTLFSQLFFRPAVSMAEAANCILDSPTE